MQLDDAAGNGDGLANPGETAGPGAAAGQPRQHRADGRDGHAEQPAAVGERRDQRRRAASAPIAGGAAAWSQGDFGVTLGPDAPGGARSRCGLVAPAARRPGPAWSTLTVTGPRGVADLSHVFGGPGGTMDPGETGS